jgi:hypothetical protein
MSIRHSLNRPLCLYAPRPRAHHSEIPVLFAHHGYHRNGMVYRDHWLNLVDEASILAISIEFPKGCLPDVLGINVASCTTRTAGQTSAKSGGSASTNGRSTYYARTASRPGSAMAGLLLLVRGEDRLATEFDAGCLGVGPAARGALQDAAFANDDNRAGARLFDNTWRGSHGT